MSTIGSAYVYPYSSIGNPVIDALGEFCTGFYTALFSGNETGVLQYISPDLTIVQSPTMPYNQSIFQGLSGAFSVAEQQNQYLLTNNLTIRVYTLDNTHCIANGIDPNATLLNNTLETFRFEYFEQTYIENGRIQAAKPYFYNIYPIMLNQMLERNAFEYVNWKNVDVKQKDAQIDAWYATHDDFNV
ncbi:hypothetical protein K435DRAFT_836083 [Dendrothele bispora CBS 962.96]|uniref:Uncharacterized protein n=1 Tax=Dendrothele bispora (strain CBS 962.96) TaxID=1314807 RepID=A0A4S8MJR7_DENBC|nr:hypothetical protein K435DRAFT_836083 [Dendrothele bispora CBS 962.96]